jgi:hypothetical protein
MRSTSIDVDRLTGNEIAIVLREENDSPGYLCSLARQGETIFLSNPARRTRYHDYPVFESHMISSGVSPEEAVGVSDVYDPVRIAKICASLI